MTNQQLPVVGENKTNKKLKNKKTWSDVPICTKILESENFCQIIK